MAFYTFYPCKADGVAGTFVCRDLPDDEAARALARRLLEQHPSAERMTIWCGERKVAARARGRAGEGAAPRRASATG